LHPHSWAEELDDRTGGSTVSNAGESGVEGRNMPRRNTWDVTPRLQSRGREEEDDERWSITQDKWAYGIDAETVIPPADGPEERKEYEVRKNHFMRLAPDTIARTRRAGKAVQEASNAAIKAGKAAMQVASDATKAAEAAKLAAPEMEESADKLHQLFDDMRPTVKGPQQTIRGSRLREVLQ
jgi:hypothetical protein